MSYFGLTEESNGINLSKDGFSSPYILNITNNTPQEQTVTVFNANEQIPEVNNTLNDGIQLYSGNTLLTTLYTPTGILNGKPTWDFSLLGINWRIASSHTISGFRWILRRLSLPNLNPQWVLNQNSALPIPETAVWVQSGIPPYDITDFNTKREVQATSSIPGVTYEQILQQSTVEPFNVGLTQIYSSNISQLLEPIQRVEKDVNGTLTKIPFVPTIDPYQNNVVLLEFSENYTIDGNIGLQFRALPNTSVKLVIYATVIAKPQNVLEGANEIEEYKAPKDGVKEIVLPTKDENFSSFSGDRKPNYKPLLLGVGLLATLYLIFKKWD